MLSNPSQQLKQILNYVNQVKGYNNKTYHSNSTVNLYDIYVQEWSEHYWKFVEKNPDKPWNWYIISYNPNITMEIIEKYPDKPWDWGGISIAKFNKEKQDYLLHKHCEYVKLHLSEDLAMISNHPLQVEKYLNMGYEIEELDNIM